MMVKVTRGSLVWSMQGSGIRWSYLLDERHEDVKEVNLVSSAQRHIHVDQLDGVWFGNSQRVRQIVAELGQLATESTTTSLKSDALLESRTHQNG